MTDTTETKDFRDYYEQLYVIDFDSTKEDIHG